MVFGSWRKFESQLIELARVSLGNHELKIDPNKRSSRWTLSSAASDRGFPRDLKEIKECRWVSGVMGGYASCGGSCCGRAVLCAVGVCLCVRAYSVWCGGCVVASVCGAVAGLGVWAVMTLGVW